MSKILICLCIVFAVGFQSLAQIDDIRKQADKHKNDKKDDDKSIQGSHNNSNSNDGACFDACCSGCANEVVATLLESLLMHHQTLMARRSEYPHYLSFEVMPHVGYGKYFSDKNNNYINFLPRIRGNWGVFSTDFRMNYLATYDNYKADVFKTLEWDAFLVNICADDVFKFTIGTGFLYEYYTKQYYNEHYLGIELGFDKRAFLTTVEGRFATNYETNMFVEASVRENIRFIKFNRLQSYLNIGFVYQNYYQNVDLFMGQVGFTFVIQ